MKREPTLEEIHPKERVQARLLHIILVACAKHSNKAAVVVRSVHDKNGFVTWQRLVRACKAL